MPLRQGPRLIYRSAPERPEWITKLPPSEDYFYAVGIETVSPSLQKAKQSAVQMAVTEVANYLGVQTSVRFEQKKTELVTNALREITTASRARVEGSRMSEMYYEQYRDIVNGKVLTTYDVYVLLRIPFVEIQQEKERQEKERRQALVQTKRIIAEGVKDQQEGNLKGAFQKWFLALEIVEETAPASVVKYEIVNKIKSSINQMTISFTPPLSTSEKMLRRKKGEGFAADTKKIINIEQLPTKLSVYAQFSGKKDIPLKNIPLRLGFLTGQGVIDQSAVTDTDGRADFAVYSVEPWPQKVMLESHPVNILPESKKLSSDFIEEIENMMNNKRAIYVFSAGKTPLVQPPPSLPVKYKKATVKLPLGKEVVSISIKPSNQYVLSTEDTRLFLCLKVDLKGVDLINPGRPPLNIALVLDRSGSMEEEKKMEYAKEAAKFLIDNLSPNDFISLVAYDTAVEVINPAGNVVHKNLLKHKVENIFSGGTTNLSGGLSEGYNQVLINRKDNFINRVLLLSDGLANVGITDEKLLFSLAKDYRKQGISVSALGIGTDFNEDLMLGLAEYSGGNYYFVKNPEKIPEIFQRELNQLLAVVAQNITVDIYVKSGVELVDVFEYVTEEIPGGFQLRLGDISSGERKVLIVELKPPGRKEGKKEIAKVVIKYNDILGGRGMVKKEETISVIYTDKPRMVARGEDEEVNKYVRIICAAQIMQKAMKTMDAELYDETIDILMKEYISITKYAKIHSDEWLIEKAETFKHCADELKKMKESGKIHNYDAMKGMRKELHYQEMMMRHHK